jgi:phosphoadenosine phosphosulfate reductase
VPILRREPDGVVKVHPLATLTGDEARAYMLEHGVPEHPLVKRRYLSIGCEPCTRPVADGEDERAGRWAGTGKTECGLHTRFGAPSP